MYSHRDFSPYRASTIAFDAGPDDAALTAIAAAFSIYDSGCHAFAHAAIYGMCAAVGPISYWNCRARRSLRPTLFCHDARGHCLGAPLGMIDFK